MRQHAPRPAGAVKLPAGSPAATATRRDLVALQRRAGNRAVANLVRGRVPRPSTAVVQRLPANQIHVGTRYRYIDRETELERTGTLTKIAGSWYTFDNGKTQGSAKVVATEDPLPGLGGVTSFAQAIALAGQSLGLTKHIVLSVVIELTSKELENLGTWELLGEHLTDARSIASCMKTATNLVELFVTGQRLAHGTATRGDRDSVAATAAAMCLAIRQYGGGGCMVNVTYGIHGFVVLVWGDHAELLQSFADRDEPETLASNFSKPRTFTREGVCTVLTAMVDPVQGRRELGQTAIAGDTDPKMNPLLMLEDAKNQFPDVDFKWEARPLQAPAIVLARVQARLEQNQKVVAAFEARLKTKK